MKSEEWDSRKILVHKTFKMELAVKVCFAYLIAADDTPVLMNFTYWILFLGWIGGYIPDENIPPIKNELIGSLKVTISWLTFPDPCQVSIRNSKGVHIYEDSMVYGYFNQPALYFEWFASSSCNG